MKKYFILSFIALITVTPDVFAGAKYKIGDTKRCIVRTDVSPDRFWYCGSQDMGCADEKDKGKDNYFYDHLKEDTWGNNTFICCKNHGWQFVLPTTPTTKTATKTFDDGGTCDYTVSVDKCGYENHSNKDTQCKYPSDCTQGKIKRNNACIVPCPSGQGYETTASNTCIDCPTTNHGGVHPTSGDCIKCHETAELFSYKTGECKKKSEIKTQYTNSAFASCWKCETNNDFKKCVEILRGKTFDKDKIKTIPKSCGGDGTGKVSGDISGNNKFKIIDTNISVVDKSI